MGDKPVTLAAHKQEISKHKMSMQKVALRYCEAMETGNWDAANECATFIKKMPFDKRYYVWCLIDTFAPIRGAYRIDGNAKRS
jgi:hypothetical protein